MVYKEILSLLFYFCCYILLYFKEKYKDGLCEIEVFEFLKICL